MQRLCVLGIALLSACAAPADEGSDPQTYGAPLVSADGGRAASGGPGGENDPADQPPPALTAQDGLDEESREERMARSRERVRAELRAEPDLVLADVTRVEHDLVHLQHGATTYELPYVTAELRLVRRLRGAREVEEAFRLRFPQNLESIGLYEGGRYVLALDGQGHGGLWKVARARLGRHAARRVEGAAIASNQLAVDDLVEEGGGR